MMEAPTLRSKHLAGTGSVLRGRRTSIGADPLSPRPPAKTEEAASGAENLSDASGKDRPASVEKITDFLRYTKGLVSFSCEDLEAMLYDLRFELLPPPKTGSDDNHGIANRKLPLFSDIPPQEELHDMLVSGAIPGGFQCVAHVLYPDHVPWPSRAESTKARQASPSSSSSRPQSAPQEDATHFPRSESEPLGEGQTSSTTATPTPFRKPVRRAATERAAVVGDTGSRPQPTGLRSSSPVAATTAVPEDQESEDIADEDVAVGQTNGDYVLGLRSSEEMRQASVIAEVRLRGQTVSTTLRGRTVPQKSEEAVTFAIDARREYDQYMIAKEKRVKLEKTLQLEEYQEKKLAERIEILEYMQHAEREHQKELKAKEARRLARKEELARQMELHHRTKWEEVRKQEEEKEEKHAKEEEAEQRRRQRQQQKRQEVERWKQEAQVDDTMSVREDDARQRREALRAKEQAAREEKERNRLRPPAQVETEQRIARTQVAIEERPPVAPRMRDKPPSVFAMAGKAEPYARESEERPRVPRATEVNNIPKVAGVYGLSEREQTLANSCVERCMLGVGRIAVYDKRPVGQRSATGPAE